MTMKQIRWVLALAGLAFPALAQAGANYNLTQTASSATMSLRGTLTASTAVFASSPWVDVRAYGAQCDGTTDDTTAINTAIAAACDRKLYIPGICAVSASLTLPHCTFTVFGNGWSVTNGSNALLGSVIKQTANNKVLFDVVPDGVTGHDQNVNFEDVGLQGPAFAVSAGTAVRLGNTMAAGLGEGWMTNVGISQFNVGIELESVQDWTFTSVNSRNCQIGVLISSTTGGQADQNTFYNIQLTGNATALMNVNSATGNTFYGGLVEGNATAGLILTNANRDTFDGIWFENPGISTGDIVAQGGSSFGNHFTNNFFADFRNAVVDTSSNETYDGNSCAGGGSIYLNGGAAMSAIGNTCSFVLDPATQGFVSDMKFNDPRSGVSVSGGFIQPWSRTIAQLLAIVPGFAGQQYYCSNCSPAKIVVSTGTSAGNFADPAGGAFK